MGKLKEHKLFAKASQCDMLKTYVEFLGQQISRDGMTPTEAKLKAVRDWATPEDVKGVWSFLGFAKLLPTVRAELCSDCGPLDIILTRKDVEWQ